MTEAGGSCGVNGALGGREAVQGKPFLTAAAWLRLVAPMPIPPQAITVATHRPQIGAIRLRGTLDAGSIGQGVCGDLRIASRGGAMAARAASIARWWRSFGSV